MTNRYDELSDRARWFLNNFDEIDLADICANNETAATKAQEALARVQALAEQWQAAMRPGEKHPAAQQIHAALNQSAPKETA